MKKYLYIFIILCILPCILIPIMLNNTAKSITEKKKYAVENRRDPGERFFIRYIDSLTNDTLYTACIRFKDGRIVRDSIPIINGEDTVMYAYCLNNAGDTILLESEAEDIYSDSIGSEDSVHYRPMKGEEKEVIREMYGYLKEVRKNDSLEDILYKCQNADIQ